MDLVQPIPMVRMAADQVYLFFREMMINTKNVLQRELEKVQARIAALEAAVEAKPDYGLGKGDPAVTRWELDRVLLQDLREQAQRLEQALSRTGEGTYGICEQCGNPIHPDRLAVLPDARLCIRCARSPRGG